MFRFFRRYQKTFIVIGGVILMFVFTVGDTISQWMASQTGGEGRFDPKATAVSWDGGKLSEAELRVLMQKRTLAGRFIGFAYQEGGRRAMEAGLTDRHRVVPIAQFNRDTPTDVLERDVVRRYILAKRAEDMGIIISDREVQNYISEIGLRMLDGQDVQNLLSAIGGGGPSPSATQLFDAIRHELMAEAGQRALGSSGTPLDLFAAEMPVDRWEEWKQMNDQIVIEAAAISPASALLDVDDPTEKELREFFDKHKDSTGAPVPLSGLNYLPSPEPGFKIPRQVKLAYLRADYNAFIERFEKEVTDEQISEYYEENKFRFPASRDLEAFDDLESDDTESSDTEGEEADSTDEESTEEMTEESDSAEPEAEETTTDEPTDEETVAEETSPEESAEEETAEESITDEPTGEEPTTDEPAGEEAATDEPAAEETPNEESTSDEPAVEETTEEPSGESTSVKNSPFRLASFQETEEATDTADATEGEASEESTEATSEPEGESETADEAIDEAEDASETEESVEESADTSEEGTEADESVEDPAEVTEEASETEESAEEDDLVFAPLEEVADDIRRRLAEDRFDAEIDEIMRSAIRRLKPAYSRYLKAMLDANARGEDAPKPPAELTDLSPIANDLNLVFEETGELSFNELLETPLGKSFCPDKYIDERPARITEVAFGDDVELFEPILSEDFGRISPMFGGGFADRYVVLKISDEPTRVPSFEEVEDKVRTAWRNEQAAEKALEKAKSTAKKAQESGLGLTDFFIDDEKVEVTVSKPFALYTVGDFAPTGRVNYRLSQPEALKDVGVEFLSELFKMEEGEVTALANFDKSIIYVVRAADEVESPEELKSNFLEQTNYWQGRLYFRDGNLRRIRPITQQYLLEDIELEWQRPDQESDTDEQESDTDEDENEDEDSEEDED